MKLLCIGFGITQSNLFSKQVQNEGNVSQTCANCVLIIAGQQVLYRDPQIRLFHKSTFVMLNNESKEHQGLVNIARTLKSIYGINSFIFSKCIILVRVMMDSEYTLRIALSTYIHRFIHTQRLFRKANPATSMFLRGEETREPTRTGREHVNPHKALYGSLFLPLKIFCCRL